MQARLNRESPLRRSWFIIVLTLWPAILIAYDFSLNSGLLSLARVGDLFYPNAIDELKAVDPPRRNQAGYDGQFYLQMAVDPSLKNPQLKMAVDDLGYRGQRIGLSALAYVLGAGQPRAIFQIYCGLNIVFWFALLAMMLKLIGTKTMVQQLVVCTVLWSAGTLVSMTRALADLPALTLCVAACLLAERDRGWLGGIAAAAFAGLTKETSILSLPGFGPTSPRRWLRWSLTLLIVLVPLAAWQYYIKTQIGSGASGLQNFTWPVVGWAGKLATQWSELLFEFPHCSPLEMIAPLSIAVQAATMFAWPAWSNRWWRLGIGFAILSVVIAQPVWASQSAYSRVLLPLTLAFNLVLLQHFEQGRLGGRWYTILFWIGNVGLLDRAIPGLLLWWLAIAWQQRTRNTLEMDTD